MRINGKIVRVVANDNERAAIAGMVDESKRVAFSAAETVTFTVKYTFPLSNEPG